MAEKLFEDALAKSKFRQKIRVFSAGLTAVEGDKPSENSVVACEEDGLDLPTTAAPSSPVPPFKTPPPSFV